MSHSSDASSQAGQAPAAIIRPQTLNLQAIDVCNSRCIMCNIWKDGRNEKMSLDELRAELANPFYSEVRHVGVTGGEPTLRKDLFELYELFPKCLPKLTGASFITHGMQTERAVEVYTRVHAHYRNLGLTFDGMVSLDGVGEMHDRVRGRKGAFDAATKTLLGLKQNGVGVVAACTIVRANVYGLHDLLDWGKANGVYVRFRVAEFIRRLYNDSCASEVRAFSPRELRHLVSFFHVLLADYETGESIRKTYNSILSLLTGGERLIGCPYQKGAAVNLDSRGWLACCAPKGTSFKPGSDVGEVHSTLSAQRVEVAKEHCANCIHDYHDDWNQSALLEISQARTRGQELYGMSEQQLTTRELDAEPLDLPAMKQVLLAGWYGTETAGDIAILHGIIDEYLAVNPQLQFQVLSLYPYYTRTTVAMWPDALQAKVRVIGYESEEAWQATQDCDAVVMAGGPLMDISETKKILCLFKRFADLGKPRVIEGCGVGPLNRVDFRWNVCRIARLATKISVRDNSSRETLRSYGIRKAVEVRLDPAVTFVRAQGIRHHGSDATVIRCFLRELTCEYPQAVTSAQATENLVNLLTNLLAWYPEHRIELWAMHHFPVGNDDRLFAKQLVKRIGDPRLTCDWEPRTPKEILEAMAAAEFCVCMRFHSCVFASEVGAPFLAIDYTNGGKIKAFLDDIGQAPRLTRLGDLPALEKSQFETKLRTPRAVESTNAASAKTNGSKASPTVLHIIQNVIGGGGARAMISLAKHSHRLGGYNHRLFSLSPADAVGLDLAKQAGLPVLNQPGRDELNKAIAEADLVLVHWWNNPDLATLFRSDLPASRLALWLHVGGYHSPQVLSRNLIDFADLSVACSPHTYAHPVFAELPEETRLERTAMVLAGADFDRLKNITPRPHKGFRVGYIGTVDPVKMHADFVAMSCAVDVPEVSFVVCGNGDTRWLSSEAEKRGRSSSFDFRGPVEDIRSVIETLDVYGYPLCPDTYAAAELNLQEVMFAGLPVVAFPFGGIGKLIQHGETGILVNTPEEYARAIEALAKNPAERARIGANAAAFAKKHWGAESAAREFNAHFERLLTRPKRARQWGVPPGTSLADLAPSLADQISPLAVHPGARMFIESLEDGAQPFLDSLNASNLQAAVEAEDRIAALPRMVHGTGVLPFRNAFPRDPFLHLWAGLGFLKAGNAHEAFNAFSMACQAGFEQWRIHWYRALSAERAGRPADAAAALKLVLQASPDFAPAREMIGRLGAMGHAVDARPSATLSESALRYVEQAEQLLQRGQLSPARDWLERASDLLPGNLELMEAITELDCRLGDLDSARLRYDAIRSLDPKRTSLRLDRIREALGLNPKPVQPQKPATLGQAGSFIRAAKAAVEQGNSKSAIEALENAHNANPDHAGVLVALGELLIGEGNFSAAVAPLTEAVSLTPEDTTLHVLLAKAHVRLGHVPEFEKHLARALEIDPAFPPAHRVLGDLMMEEGHFADAALQYREALKNSAADATLLLDLATCLAKCGETDAAAAAQEEARRGLRADASRRDTLVRLEAICPTESAPAPTVAAVSDSASDLSGFLVRLEPALAAQDFATAESILGSAVEAFPDNAELVKALANLQFQMGRFEQAIPSFKIACRLDPQDPLMPVLLAHCHLNVEDVEGFESAIARSLQVQPGNPHALRLVGDVNVRFGRHAEAAKAYGALVNQGVADVDVMFALGLCFQEIGQLPGAHACFTEVVRLQPAHSEANRLLAELEQKLRKSGAAVPVHQSQPEHEQVPCPACGSRSAKTVRNRADIVQCGDCQTVYLRTRLTKEAMRKLYQSYADEGSHMALPKSLEDAEKSGLARKKFLNEILAFIQPGGEFLDVGCGWGGFLLNARNNGFQPRGIELTRRCVAYAKDNLGIPVVDTQLEDTEITPGSLSVVTMNHVLEHLPEPRKALKKVIDSLKPGGMYCGIVPNFQSACSTNEGENWYWLDPFYHYTHFTPATLKRALESAGFVVERIYTAVGDYGVENVRKGCLKADPKLKDDDYFKAELKRYEDEGRGEEIRFFARKPAQVAKAPAPEIIGGQGIGAPVVSVIVSTYNSEKFIRPCLENLTRQTIFPQVEVIVVDSGSEQNEGAIVAEFAQKHPNIRYVRSARETLYGAWNRGLAEAKGRYWVNANTDDAMRDDALEIFVKAMDAAPTLPVAYGDCVWTSTPNDRFPSKTVMREVRYPDYVPIHSVYYCITGCLQFWRTEFLRELGGFDASLRAAGDYEVMTRLVERGGSALHVGEFLSLFYQNTSGLTQTDRRAADEHETVCNRFRERVDVSKIFACPTGSAKERALALTMLGASSLNFTVPWEDRSMSHGAFAFSCFEKAISTSPDCQEAWQNFAAILLQLGQLDDAEKKLKARWPQFAAVIGKVRAGAGLAVPSVPHAIEGPVWNRLPSAKPVVEGIEQEPEALRPWISKRDGRFTYLSPDLLPRSRSVIYSSAELESISTRLFTLLGSLPRFRAHFGGAGDALLLMAGHHDASPKMPIVSYPNSHASARAFFEAFPDGGQVYLLPLSADPQVHVVFRWMMHQLKNCAGMGTTPVGGYAEEWKEGLDIQRAYKVVKNPKWAAAFRDNRDSKRIAIAPKGSLAGMAGSKRNIIDPANWSRLIGHVIEQGFQPVLVGTPDEAADYPVLEGCISARSWSFRQQMEEIGRCAGLIGADSWAKTFSGLAELPTIVFEPLKGEDLRGWKDPADYVFIKPWPSITMVNGMDEFRSVFAKKFLGIPAGTSAQAAVATGKITVSWEGSFLDLGSLSHVNRELTDLLAADKRFTLACVGANAIPASMRNDSDWKRRAKKLLAEPTGKATVTVRHQWPPDWSRPANGALVVIQPWEFGSLPKEWATAAKDVDEFWVPSEYVRQVYIGSGVEASKVHVVPNGVDTKLYRPEAKPRALKTAKKFKLLFVGATIGRKGPDVLLQSYLATFTAADDVCLVIKDFGGDSVYAGQTMGALIEQARKQPNTPEILYLNQEIAPDEMPGLFTACDCLVHPFRGEGFGMPILEAMACGLPVVVTQGGAADDFVSETNGWLIRSQRRPIGNSVSNIPLVGEGWLLEPDASHLSTILRDVVANPALAKEKGKTGAKLAREKFNWSNVADIAANRLTTVAGRKAVAGRDGGVKPKATMAKIILPPCALLGHVGQANELLRQRKLSEAWKSACAAIEERPFNPPAFKVLGEIAAAAGDYALAKDCLEILRPMAPGWNGLKDLTRQLMGKSGGKASGFTLPTKPGAPRLSVCLIAKNEERFLEQCLKSVKDIAWEIVVVDTGSTDRTVEIAKSFGAKIGGFTWCDDFAAARNEALELVRGDWVLVLDADEIVRSETIANLKKELADAAAIAWRIPLFNVGKEDQGSCVVPRLFRNAPALFYVGRVHEQIFTSVEVRRQEWGLENKMGRTELLHFGYTEEMTRDRNKIERNLKLLEKAVEEIPDDANLIFNLGMEKVRLGRVEEGLVHYRDAIQILNTTPVEQLVPELREVCLTQFLGILKEARKFNDLVEALQFPVVQRGPLTASMHYLAGFAQVQLGHHEEAVKHLRACLAQRNERTLAPIHADIRTAAPHHCLAVALANLKRTEEAEAAFESARAASPQSAAVILDYSRFEAGRGETAKALHLLHAVLGTDPKHSMLWRFGAQILLQKPELAEIGDQWTSEALNHFPADRELLAARGEMLLLNGRAQEALAAFELVAKNGVARLVAADIVCRLATGSAPAVPVTDTETTREFLVWYRRLVQWQATGLVNALNEVLPQIEKFVPKAGAVIRSVLAEATA